MTKDPFTEYVDAWDELVARREKLVKEKAALTASIDKALKEITDSEMTMRKSIAQAVKDALGEQAKEGVNRYSLPDGRRLKLTLKTTREIDQTQITNAREKFSEVNDTSGVTFDELLRIKYELEKREWNKLNEGEKLAVSRMVTTKDAAPVVEFD